MKEARYFEYQGKMYSIRKLSKLSGCCKNTMYKRLLADKLDVTKSVEDTSLRDLSKVFIEYKGRKYSVKELCKETNRKAIEPHMCCYLLNSSIEEVMEVIIPRLKAGKPGYDMHAVNEISETFEWRGKQYTVKELAEIKGVSQKKMSDYLDTYSSIDEIMKI